MTTTRAESEVFFQIDNFFYNDQLNKVINQLYPKFVRSIKSYVLFHILFLIIGISELVIFVAFFSVLAQSSLVALSLGGMFLTLFSYLVFRLYMKNRKPEKFKSLRKQYYNACRELLNCHEEVPEYYVTLANAYCKFATHIQGNEYNFYKLPSWFDALAPSMERFSCWWHWEDIFLMRELLLQCSVEEHIKLVKSEPTNLEVHAALANAYVMLSGLYVNPKNADGYGDDRWIPSEKFTKEMTDKFRDTAQRAIEEFKILNDYAPDDPWIHVQLAYSYHDLRMPHEEIREYEEVLRLCPTDTETLYKLGVLYFEQGFNAQGLNVYEELKESNFKKAESLIKHYGAYHLFQSIA